MSTALAAARKRRAPPQQNETVTTPQSQPNVNATGLTLPQVISIIDKRLVNLETFAKNTNEQKKSVDVTSNQSQPDDNAQLNEIISEYNSRFELLAEEIGNLKDIVLKLQSYTMEVNKTLMEERINVLSDFSGKPMPDFSHENITFDKTDEELTSMDLKNLVKQEFSEDVDLYVE